MGGPVVQGDTAKDHVSVVVQGTSVLITAPAGMYFAARATSKLPLSLVPVNS